MPKFQIGEATLEVSDKYDWLQMGLIYLIRHGSQAYGTSLPTSDLDVKGIVIAPPGYYIGIINRSFTQVEGHNPDFVVYELRRFVELAASGNPNMIEMLFVDRSDHLRCDPVVMTPLLQNRHLILSKKVRASFAGYAHQQLKRIKTHRAWLLNPPGDKPTRALFGLPELSTISSEQIKAAQHLNNHGFSYDTNFQDLVYREKQYDQATRRWASYENWKATRNPARHELEAQYGYDTKHAMHLVRLVRMCMEILITGEVRVRRPDAQELLAIRSGAWTYDQLIAWADEQEGRMDELAQKSPLPDEPDLEALDRLVQRIIAQTCYFKGLAR